MAGHGSTLLLHLFQLLLCASVQAQLSATISGAPLLFVVLACTTFSGFGGLAAPLLFEALAVRYLFWLWRSTTSITIIGRYC